jgi:hypothetical protein
VRHSSVGAGRQTEPSTIVLRRRKMYEGKWMNVKQQQKALEEFVAEPSSYAGLSQEDREQLKAIARLHCLNLARRRKWNG